MRQIKKLIISVTLLVTVLWLVKSLSDPWSHRGWEDKEG